MVYSVIFCIFIQYVFCDDKDLFSSTFEMQRLLRTEMEFSKNLFKYIKSLEDPPQKLKTFVDKTYPNGPFKISENVEEYVANPLNALGLIQRLGIQTENIKDVIKEVKDESNLTMEIWEQMKLFPTENNYKDATGSVGVLQEAYDLNITAIAQGIIQVGDKMYKGEFKPNWKTLANIGTTVCNNGLWDTGLQWIKEALESDDGSDPGFRKHLLSQFKRGKQIHDHLLDHRGPLSEEHRCFPVPFDEKLKKKKKYKKAKKQKVKSVRETVPLYSWVSSSRELRENFYRLCKDGVNALRSPEMDIGLKCHLLHHNDPYLRLGPFKLEVRNKNPFLVIFKDFLSHRETEHFKVICN